MEKKSIVIVWSYLTGCIFIGATQCLLSPNGVMAHRNNKCILRIFAIDITLIYGAYNVTANCVTVMYCYNKTIQRKSLNQKPNKLQVRLCTSLSKIRWIRLKLVINILQSWYNTIGTYLCWFCFFFFTMIYMFFFFTMIHRCVEKYSPLELPHIGIRSMISPDFVC